MRLKEIQRTAHQAWSPASHHPIYLALGTSAQQLDASFNTTAALEIFEMDFADPSLDMKISNTSVFFRLHSIVWVNFGLGADGTGGRLVSGSENGAITVYNVEAILESAADAVVGQSDKHTGPVRALDFNPFQSNLLASGANDSEIYIWDLNNFNNPMTPGAKSQPAEDISVVSWNRQVQHILASANPSGKAVVWDLRKNEPIIKISDHSNRMHCSGMLWHPEVATQLVLASEDDRMPVIQMWDLRFATSPLKVLENHTRGILSISWSQADPETLAEQRKGQPYPVLEPTTQESCPPSTSGASIVQWCPRNPALLSTASFDGKISSSVDKISSSFDNMDPFGMGQTLPPLQVPQPTAQTTIVPPLKKPPKWVRRPVGASFAFGGKLSPQPVPRQVFVSQVTTETEFLQRSRELQAALQAGTFVHYCQAKIQSAPCDAEQDIWKFLMVNFEDEARVKFLRLLGFSKDELERKVGRRFWGFVFILIFIIDAELLIGVNVNYQRLTMFEDFKMPGEELPAQWTRSGHTDGLISQALLVGNFEGAVDLCLNDGRYAEAILLSISGGEELLKKTQQRYLDTQKNSISMLISSVVTQNWRDIVQSCELDNWKEALAALLTYAHPEEFAPLCDTLGGRLETEGTEKRSLQACLCYICSGNLEKLVECWAVQRDCSSPLVLEDLVEKVMILRKSIERLRNSEVPLQSPTLAEKLTCYAGLLAAEGSLATAMTYLPDNSDQVSGTGLWSLVPDNYTPPTPITAPVMGFQGDAGQHHDHAQVPPGAPQEPSVQVGVLKPYRDFNCTSSTLLQLLQQLPAERVEQREIPAEHMILKSTFDSLVQRCQLAAADPQTKRKLEDAAKRLGYLYDKLREQSLSPSILGGLHEISRCVGGQNYQRGLEVHTQVVGSSNFSEISAFMPILKVVMTIANKLGV
uniref:SEC31 homolog B, COPII coat complex component n=1 Tax=Gadus morhua TaxID=8049 RepID=A0A8C5F3G5_GADMO